MNILFRYGVDLPDCSYYICEALRNEFLAHIMHCLLADSLTDLHLLNKLRKYLPPQLCEIQSCEKQNANGKSYKVDGNNEMVVGVTCGQKLGVEVNKSLQHWRPGIYSRSLLHLWICGVLRRVFFISHQALLVSGLSNRRRQLLLNEEWKDSIVPGRAVYKEFSTNKFYSEEGIHKNVHAVTVLLLPVWHIKRKVFTVQNLIKLKIKEETAGQ